MSLMRLGVMLMRSFVNMPKPIGTMLGRRKGKCLR